MDVGMNGSARRTAAPIRDLREWLARVEASGELLRIPHAVSLDQEMSAITYLMAKRAESPALLFDNPQGFEKEGIGARLLWNILGSSHRRVALSFEESGELPALELISRLKDKLARRVPPQEVERSQASVYENSLLHGDVDLGRLPIPRHWPLDGGRYAGTADMVVTRDPESGVVNVGTYRMMIQGRNQAGLYLSPGKDALSHITRSWQRGQPVQVAAAWGIDPLYMIVGSMTVSAAVSEYDHLGGIKGEPVRVVRGTTTDLPLPADAELVVEGLIRPNAMKMEGPFGEFTGFYGRPEAECPLVEVTAVHYRTRPILTNALLSEYPSNEESLFIAYARSARIWNDLEKLGVPGIRGVYAVPASAMGMGMTVISLEQRYAGHAAQALALAGQVPGGAYYTKWIIAVDEDIDPSNMDEVIWAMSTRCNPAGDIDIQRNTWSTMLDPSQNPPENRPYGSKALINACKDHRHIKTFSKRMALRKEVYEQVVKRWASLGLPGEPPPVRAFESAPVRPLVD